MFFRLPRTLGGALLRLLPMLLLPLVLMLFLLWQGAKKKPPSSVSKPDKESPYYDRQLRQTPSDPFYGRVLTLFPPYEELRVPKTMPKSARGGPTGILSYKVGGKLAARLAYGVDGVPYFLNAFFVDFAPDRASHIWEVHRAVRLRVRYQLDSRHFGRREIWQTSRQTYESLRGDCEDYAILLADWLIASGFEARVVIGRHKKDGHAWVVVLDGNRTYLVEATGREKRWTYPLARFLPDYRPEAMFDRDTFWVNTGSPLTTDYRGERWRPSSRFFRF